MIMTQSERYRLLARMFTRPVFCSIANTGDWQSGIGFLLRHKILTEGPTQSVSDIFEAALRELQRAYRNEYVYKSEIANRLIFGRHSPRTTALQIELPVGRSIVDAAIFNGTSTAYEIKTEFDSARRVQTQTGDYLRAFDRVFVVAHPSTAQAFSNLVDPRVGVLALSAQGSLSVVREAKSNRANLSVPTLFRCLRRTEYVHIVESTFGVKLQYPNGLLATKCLELFSEIDLFELHDKFVEAMRKRKTDPATVEFVTGLPQCLRALGYATPLSRKQRAAIVLALGQQIPFAFA